MTSIEAELSKNGKIGNPMLTQQDETITYLISVYEATKGVITMTSMLECLSVKAAITGANPLGHIAMSGLFSKIIPLPIPPDMAPPDYLDELQEGNAAHDSKRVHESTIVLPQLLPRVEGDTTMFGGAFLPLQASVSYRRGVEPMAVKICNPKRCKSYKARHAQGVGSKPCLVIPVPTDFSAGTLKHAGLTSFPACQAKARASNIDIMLALSLCHPVDTK
jgi:hypothetical protein